jgi:hypothetical protein
VPSFEEGPVKCRNEQEEIGEVLVFLDPFHEGDSLDVRDRERLRPVLGNLALAVEDRVDVPDPIQVLVQLDLSLLRSARFRFELALFLKLLPEAGLSTAASGDLLQVG